jgi:hypothetical protein
MTIPVATETIVGLYVDQLMTQQQIADHLGCCQQTVGNRLRRAGVFSAGAVTTEAGRPSILAVEARWGVEFWQLVSDFAEQGLSRFDTARAIGYRPEGFCHLLARMPGKDPFEPSSRALAYLKDTGENLRQALERMAAEGRSWGYAARAIGYASGSELKKAAIKRGILVQMNSKHPGRPRIHPVPQKRDNLTVGWPSWSQVYAMRVDTSVTRA